MADVLTTIDQLSGDDPVHIDDHQAVTLYQHDGLLRRVLVCCDCGLVHLMSIDIGSRRAYFVREDGPKGEEIRARSRKTLGRAFFHEASQIDADHDWALWREKWCAALDLMSNQSERASIAEAEVGRLKVRIAELESKS